MMIAVFRHRSGMFAFPPIISSIQPALASVLTDWWPDLVVLMSKPVSLAIVLAGLLGLFVGWLVRGRGAAPAPLPRRNAVGPEWRWRHEKLVLTERLQVEKQFRLDAFAEATESLSDPAAKAVLMRVFLLAERVREARQKVGADLSRMRVVRDRLDEILPTVERGKEAVGAARGMADAQSHRLEEAREILRGIGEEVFQIEEEAIEGKIDFSGSGDLRKRLKDLKDRVLSLPQGWATSGEEADFRIRELLATVDDSDLVPVREVLLVDGALTNSLEGSGVAGVGLPGSVAAVIAALDRGAEEARNATAPIQAAPTGAFLSNLPISLSGPNPFAEETPEFGFPKGQAHSPDSGFRLPEEIVAQVQRPATGFHDLSVENGLTTATVAAVEDADPAEEIERSLVLFCSNNVELWGKTVYRGARCRARAIESFPGWARWISIRRLDTRERVFAPIRSASLRQGQSADPFGFNGSNELFYGARHLGLFSESCPNEVETRFTYGGWGFGHRALEIAPEVEQLQAAGWEGREIPADTVFEIVIHEELPELGALDRLLEEGEVRGTR